MRNYESVQEGFAAHSSARVRTRPVHHISYLELFRDGVRRVWNVGEATQLASAHRVNAEEARLEVVGARTNEVVRRELGV